MDNNLCLYVAPGLYGKANMIKYIEHKYKVNVHKMVVNWLPGQGFDMHKWDVPELEDEELCKKIEVMYADLPVIAKYWRKLPNLKWVHTAWNGVDILMNSLNKSEPLPTFTLTKTPGSQNASLITEYVIGYMIATERSFFEAKESQKNVQWKQMIYANARSLRGLTIGILGVGDIGIHLASVCKSLGMTVWGLTRRQRTEEDASDCVDVYRTMDGLPDLLQNCDYVCSVLPSTSQTVHMLSGDMLSNCKGSVFINVGRGDVVDETSLVKALQSGWLRGAVLDVFETEPLPTTSPLWTMPGVVITPHVSGWSSDKKHMERVNEYFFTNYERFIKGQPLVGALDWKQGY